MMTFNNLDLENKVYLPTQQLLAQLQAYLINLYAELRLYLIDAHAYIAAKGNEWYADPVATTSLWYQHSLAYSSDIYEKFQSDWLPQAESSYEEMLASVSQFGTKVQDNLDYAVENRELITAEAIESVTHTITSIQSVSAEMVEALQNKTAEIVALLVDQPWQTLNDASLALLNNLIQSYYELVSSILASL